MYWRIVQFFYPFALLVLVLGHLPSTTQTALGATVSTCLCWLWRGPPKQTCNGKSPECCRDKGKKNELSYSDKSRHTCAYRKHDCVVQKMLTYLRRLYQKRKIKITSNFTWSCSGCKHKSQNTKQGSNSDFYKAKTGKWNRIQIGSSFQSAHAQQSVTRSRLSAWTQKGKNTVFFCYFTSFTKSCFSIYSFSV